MKDGELRMSQRELHRLHIVRLTLEGRESIERGAKFLGISVRQMKRLRRKMKERGVKGLLHGNQGKSPWNKTVSAKVKQVLALARGRYQGLNDTHLTEKLKEKEKMALSRPVVRTILRQAGIAAVRRRGGKRHYKRRERRAQEGALLLWDGSPHRWFGDEHGEWTLTAVIDDAIEPIFAMSPQAKGRVERLFNTLQDRLVQELRLLGITTPQRATTFLNGPFKANFNARFAQSPRDSQAAWRPLPKGLDVDRVCSFGYQATVGNDNAVRLCGIILDIPAGTRQRGYAKTRVEVRQLLDGRWRVYDNNELLLETTPPIEQAPLRTLRRKHRKTRTGEKPPISKAMTRNDRIRARLTHDRGVSHT